MNYCQSFRWGLGAFSVLLEPAQAFVKRKSTTQFFFEKAAWVLQSFVRRLLARISIKKAREVGISAIVMTGSSFSVFQAAVKIQKVNRGIAGRQRVNLLKNERLTVRQNGGCHLPLLISSGASTTAKRQHGRTGNCCSENSKNPKRNFCQKESWADKTG